MKTINKSTLIIRIALVSTLGTSIFSLYVHSAISKAQAESNVLGNYQTATEPSAPNGWLTRPWTASSAPYLEIRKAVFLKVKGGIPAKAVSAEERLNAQMHPRDLKAQYRWFCAANLAAPDGDDFDQQALNAIASLDPGNIQVIARSRWLSIMMTQQNESHPELEPLGERLLKADPSDRWVRLHLIYDLAAGKPGSSNDKSLAKALTMAEAWTKAEPSNPSAHSTLAYVWQTYWNAPPHLRVYAQNAIDEFNAYLRLAPPNDPFRHDAEYLVKGLTKRLPTSIP